MSMVVSSAWKTPFKNMEDVISWAQAIRPKIKVLEEEKFDEIVTNLTLNIIGKIYDNKKIPEKIKTLNSSRWVPSNLEANYNLSWLVGNEVYLASIFQSTSHERNPVFDFQAELVFIPHKGVIYAIWFGEDRDFEKLVSQSEGFENFSYDGRTDGEDDFEEYSARGQVWSNIFEEYGAPAEVGVMVDILPKTSVSFREKNIPLYVTDELRKNYIAIKVDDTLGYNSWLNIGNNREEAQKLIDDKRYFSAIEGYREWKKSDEGKAQIQTITDEYSSRFPSVEKLIKYFTMKSGEILEDIGGING